MPVSLLQANYINASKELKLVKLKVTGMKMNKGVYQDSILGPLIFNIFYERFILLY